MTTVYIVTSGEYSDYRINRVYLNRQEAYAHVDAYNATNPYEEREVEEHETGAPAGVEGPGWVGRWQAGWQTPEGRYTNRTDHPEHFRIDPEWISAETRINAEVTFRSKRDATVHGFSKEHVEKTLYDTAAQLKAELAGIA